MKFYLKTNGTILIKIIHDLRLSHHLSQSHKYFIMHHNLYFLLDPTLLCILFNTLIKKWIGRALSLNLLAFVIESLSQMKLNLNSSPLPY